MKIKMPTIGDGTTGNPYRPKYGDNCGHIKCNGYHFQVALMENFAICTELLGIPFSKDILEQPDVEILDDAWCGIKQVAYVKSVWFCENCHTLYVYHLNAKDPICCGIPLKCIKTEVGEVKFIT